MPTYNLTSLYFLVISKSHFNDRPSHITFLTMFYSIEISLLSLAKSCKGGCDSEANICAPMLYCVQISVHQGT